MNDESTSNECIHIGQRLITHYLARRRETVIEALIDMRPDLIVLENLTHIFIISDLSAKIADFVKRYNSSQVHFKGKWRHDWSYQLHGTGCELRNDITNELFDWDMSDPMVFTKTEFEQHVQWRCKQDNQDKFVKAYLDWINNGHSISEFWMSMEDSHVIQFINEYEVKLV